MTDKFCPQCGHPLHETDVFCDQCGHKIETLPVMPKAIKAEIEKPVIASEKLKGFGSHFEFLGYQIKFHETDKKDGKCFGIATHEKHNNILFWEINSSLVIFQITLQSKTKHSVKIDRFLNIANTLATVCKVFSHEEDGFSNLKIEAIYTGDYFKTLFGQFYEVLQNDQQIIFSRPEFKAAFID